MSYDRSNEDYNERESSAARAGFLPYTHLREEIATLRKKLAESEVEAWGLVWLMQGLLEEYEDRKCQWGSECLWEKHEDMEVITSARRTVARWVERAASELKL